MEWDLFIMISVMFGTAVYLLLDRALLHVVMGVIVFSNAVNLLLILTSGSPEGKSSPILEGAESISVVDPIPHALILTAIVIGFGLISFFSVVVFKIFNVNKTDDLDELFRRKN